MIKKRLLALFSHLGREMGLQHAMVASIKGVGPKRVAQLNKLGIFTAEDLLSHLPRDYRDLTRCMPVEQLRTGQPWFGLLTIKEDARLSYIRRGLNIVRVRAYDTTGTIAIQFYNQPYYKRALTSGRQYYVYGTPVHSGGEIRLVNPMMEAKEQSEGLRMLPVYRTTAGLSQTVMRTCIRQCLFQYGDTIQDVLPRALREKYKLMSLRDAYQFVHFPAIQSACESAINTLSFTELLLLRLFLENKRKQRGIARPLSISLQEHEKYLSALGFTPTGAQKRAMGDIQADMEKEEPMRRLLQGDVGSGKTAVAFYALYVAALRGQQGAMMAPTELLAQQHHRAGQALFEKLGFKTALVCAGMKASQRREVLEDIAHNRIHIVFGTHALLYQDIEFAKPGIVVVDEQHRFGVKQRAKLMAKADQAHALFLSATPIPRTLALIVYGDLDVSVMDEMPPGRMPVKTHIVPDNKQKGMYEFLAEKIKEGQQGYIVCPVIDEPDGGALIQSAEALYARLKKDGRFCAGLLHGRLKSAQRETVMQRFLCGDIGVLVSTTVVEVGVDVPNATVMIIENAERFGLAQLHQLRGRVGRGKEQSFCFLCTQDESNQRLMALCRTQDGFAVAQTDLYQRGPGVFLGEEQHGRADVRISGMLRDSNLLQQVVEAFTWIKDEHPTSLPTLMDHAIARYEQPMKDIALN